MNVSSKFAFFLGLALFVNILQAQTGIPQIFVYRTVTPTTIYHEGAIDTPSRATVTLRAWASADSILIGNPVAVMFCVDNGPKMQTRDSGAPHNWIDPNRIEGAYNAATNF